MFYGLIQKGLVRCVGKDGKSFIDSLSTTLLPSNHGIYTNFLNAHGRLLYEGFVYIVDDNSLLIDCDQRVVEQFIYHLKQYSLRKDVNFHNVSKEYFVSVDDGVKISSIASVRDVRATSSSIPLYRNIFLRNESKGIDLSEEYKIWRMRMGICEGPDEYVRGKSIPLEYNMDIMKGINPKKGCYLGQEFISRTLRKGVVRKRVLPFKSMLKTLKAWGDACPAIFDSQGAKCGKVISSIDGGMDGLAMLSLSSLNKVVDDIDIFIDENGMIDLSDIYGMTNLWIGDPNDHINAIPIIIDGVPKWWGKIKSGLCFD